VADVQKTVKFLLIGDATGATKALQKTGRSFLDSIKNADTFAKKAKVAGLALGAIAASAAVAGAAMAVKFGQESVDAFKRVASETLKLQRIMGGTAEDASRMRFAFKETGIDAATGSRAIGIFAKNLMTASGNGKAAEEMAKALGVSFLDAHGKILPMSELMPKLADRFASMPDGAEKTALAMKLFGKSGAALLPFLNKGAAGMKELAKRSDQMGETLSGKQLDALKKSKQAQKDWDAAMEGLQVTLGGSLLPILTKCAEFINSVAVPAFQGMGAWVAKNQKTFDALGRMMLWVWNNCLLPLVKAAIWGFGAMLRPLADSVTALGKLTGNKDMETFGEGLVQASEDAQEFSRTLQAIPDEVTPTLAVDDKASAGVQSLKSKIHDVEGKIHVAKVKGDDAALVKLKKQLKDLKEQLDVATKDRTVHIKFSAPRHVGKGGSSGAGTATVQVPYWPYAPHADGGAIVGPGTGTSDSINARLSNGEHVWTATEVQRSGGQSAMYRARAMVRSGLLKFSQGGSVGRLPSIASGSLSVGAPVTVNVFVEALADRRRAGREVVEAIRTHARDLGSTPIQVLSR
jgi:hypothetical protein